MKNFISGICVALVLFHTITAGIIVVPEFIQRAVHLTLVLVLAFLFKPMWKRADGGLSLLELDPRRHLGAHGPLRRRLQH